MRILRIRGKNLASLEGAFELDFTAAPLAGAGLFAITGPTGAGKSTLLDALCLGLFGTTPRFEAHQGLGYEVGREEDGQRITNKDPRSILRRGTASGFAEVEFVGRDGAPYRARWSVRRARDRITGNLQNATHELFDAEDNAIGRGVREVQQAIVARLGLDYDQFCRSVLLAQGEFAAFLRADQKKRAELLEAVTGTGIYRALSQRTHERFGQVRQAFAALQKEHQNIRVLGEEERAALVAEVEERKRLQEENRRAHQRAEAAVRWHRELAQRREAEAGAEGALAEAQRAWEAAAEKRSALAAVEEVAELRHLVHGADAARSRRDAAREALAAAQQQVAAAQERLEEAQELARAAVEHEGQVRLGHEALGPQLDEARQLDVEIVGAEKARSEAEENARRLGSAAAQAQARLERLVAEEATAGRQLAEAEQFLAGHGSWMAVAEQWERWQRLLERAAELRREGGQTERACTGQQEQVERLAAELEKRQAARAEAQRAREAAEAQLAAAEGAHLPEARSRLRQERVALDGEECAARELDLLARDAAATLAARKRADGEAKAAADESAALAGQLAEAKLQAERLEGERSGTETALEKALAVAGLENHRAELREGEACPLCGALEHPWAKERPAVAGMIAELRADAERLRTELGAIRSRLGEIAGRIEASRQREAAALRLVAEADERLGALQRQWSGRVASAAHQLPEEVVAGASAVVEWLKELSERRSALLERERQAEEAEQRLQKARVDAERARRGEQEAAEGLRQAESASQQAQAALRELRLELEQKRGEWKRIHAELAEPFAAVAGWEERLAADPERLCREAGELVATLRERRAACDEARDLLARLAAQKGPLAEGAAAARREADAAMEQAKARAAELIALRQRRAVLLDGESVQETERRLKLEAESAARRRQQAAAAEAEATSALSAIRAQVEARRGQLAEEEASLTQAAAALEEAARALSIEVEEVRRRLALPAAEIAAWKAELDELQQRLHGAKVLLEERQNQRRAHENEGRPDLSPEEAQQGLDAAARALEEAEEALFQSRKKLQDDDEARKQSAAFLPKIEAARAELELWEAMHELIGSANGDKFQLYAQSVTLRVLLAYANEHLRELAPRYRLERVPGTHLELQVIDCDMGDEVRSVNSLSGGETFLVSLALALGLSALSSRSTPVESLFIDEGFGTLDPQTLDTALATLDALQAAGRKVGLISHVQGMAERIGVQVRVAPKGSGRSCVEVAVR